MGQVGQAIVRTATHVCDRCETQWESSVYPWWRDQPAWRYCASCAAERWQIEERARAWDRLKGRVPKTFYPEGWRH